MDYGKIGKYIKKKRKKIGITQDELGELLGVTGKAVSKWECGSAMPDVSLFIPLSNILKIEISELLNGEDRKDKPELVHKRKNILMIILTILTISSIVFTLIMGIYYRNNYDKVHIYKLMSADADFSVNGEILTVNNNNYIHIYNIGYLGKDIINGSSLKYTFYYKDKIIFENNISGVCQDDSSKITVNKLFNSITISTNLQEPINYSNKSSDFAVKIEVNNKSKITNFYVKLRIK